MTFPIANVAGMFLTATGALLIVLYLVQTPQFAKQWLSPEGQKAFGRHQRRLVTGVGLLAAWIVLEYVAFLLA